MSEVWRLDLPSNLKFTLLAFADHADDEGYCYPSAKRIALKSGVSKRTVQRHMNELKERGILVVVEHSTGRGNTNTYRVVPSAGDTLPGLSNVPRSSLTRPQRVEIRELLVEHFEATCQYCGEGGGPVKGPDGMTWEIDRVVPAKQGGRYEPSNVTLSCGTCNRGKRDREAKGDVDTLPENGATLAPFPTKRVPNADEKVPPASENGATDGTQTISNRQSEPSGAREGDPPRENGAGVKKCGECGDPASVHLREDRSCGPWRQTA